MSHEIEHPSAETAAMVSRRDFLRASSLGAATIVGASMACRPASSDAPMAVPRFVDEEFPLAEATIATLREGLDSGA